ncbi:hypothetical protein F4U94_12165 [Sphingobium limneticum]|nr:hypothetical protein F4U94_12165 [Sphingobium limneticum]
MSGSCHNWRASPRSAGCRIWTGSIRHRWRRRSRRTSDCPEKGPLVSRIVEGRKHSASRFSTLACPERLPWQAVEGLEANGEGRKPAGGD